MSVLRRLCGLFGHWLVNVEENHARCRICRSHFFCGHASGEQIRRFLGVEE